MPAGTLLPDVAEVVLESIRSDRTTVTLVVHAARREASCPGCEQPSTRVHRYDERRLTGWGKTGEFPPGESAGHFSGLHLRSLGFDVGASGRSGGVQVHCGRRVPLIRLRIRTKL